MKFRVAYETYENKSTPSGDKIQYEHRENIDKNGKRTLIKDVAINAYDKIQTSREQCEIETILRKATEGDLSVLSMVNGNYLDITDAPNSLAEAQQFVMRSKREFDKLPDETRKKFEYNAEIYVANYGTKMWEDAVGITAAREAEKAAKQAEKDLKKLQKEAMEAMIKQNGAINE